MNVVALLALSEDARIGHIEARRQMYFMFELIQCGPTELVL